MSEPRRSSTSSRYAPPVLAALLFACAGLVTASMAIAKDFRPGDLRACGAAACASIKDRAVLRAFGLFYYGGRRPAIAYPPRRGAPAFELRDRSGHPTGIVGGTRLDRTLVYGLNCGRFRRGIWYHLPTPAVLEVRRLTARLEPLRVNPKSVPRSC
jgi:hypothetical protein